MRCLSRLVARLLLLVMLTTVFSPGFAWEAVEGMAGHAHPEGGHASMAVATADHAHAASHVDAEHAAMTLHDGCADGCANAAEGCGETLHHCCPGHVLGHLLGGTGASVAAVIVAGESALPAGRDTRFSSRIPEGLERPPRSAAA